MGHILDAQAGISENVAPLLARGLGSGTFHWPAWASGVLGGVRQGLCNWTIPLNVLERADAAAQTSMHQAVTTFPLKPLEAMGERLAVFSQRSCTFPLNTASRFLVYAVHCSSGSASLKQCLCFQCTKTEESLIESGSWSSSGKSPKRQCMNI
jgi:hypothetical protein